MNLILTQILGNLELFLLVSNNNHRFVIPLIFFFLIVNKQLFPIPGFYIYCFLTANYAEIPMPYNKRRLSVIKIIFASRDHGDIL